MFYVLRTWYEAVDDDYSTLLVRFYEKIHVSWKQILRSFTKFENGFGCESKCKNIFGTFSVLYIYGHKRCRLHVFLLPTETGACREARL